MAFRRNLDWVPNGGFGDMSVFSWGNVDGAFDQVSPAISRLLLTPAPSIATNSIMQPTGYPNTMQTVTSKRIRGIVYHAIGAEAPLNASVRCALIILERVHLAIYDLTGGEIATPSDSFMSGADANERYLWSRESMYDVSQVTQSGSTSPVWLNSVAAASTGFVSTGRGGTHPYWADVDVQSNRRVNEGEALVYSVQYRLLYAGTPAVNSVVNLYHLPMLRTLARI